MDLKRAHWRRGSAWILAGVLGTIALGAASQTTTAPVKTEPAKGEAAKQASGAQSPSPATKPAPAKPLKKVDINNATLEELRAVPLGEAEAKKIIAHRPYKARGELITKAGLPEGVYFAIKHRLELQEPRKPAPKK